MEKYLEKILPLHQPSLALLFYFFVVNKNKNKNKINLKFTSENGKSVSISSLRMVNLKKRPLFC